MGNSTSFIIGPIGTIALLEASHSWSQVQDMSVSPCSHFCSKMLQVIPSNYQK